jgi:hypothetical protein
MNPDMLKALAKNEIPQKSKNLSANDVKFLIETLSEKDDKLRYNAFMLLQENSHQSPLVYPYWDTFEKKLESDNSYQRSIGLMLIAANVQWDKEGKFSKTIKKYLNCCLDEKFITARQATQGLAHIIAATSAYNETIKEELSSLTLMQYPENQQRLLFKDIANILKMINVKPKS